MEVLKTENLKKYYEQSQIPVKAVDGIDISVEQGELKIPAGIALLFQQTGTAIPE